MTEKQLSIAVVKLAELNGWRVYTVSNTKAAGLRSHTGEGWPDLFMVRRGHALAVELKVGRNRPTPVQAAWLEALAAVPGVEAYLWTDAEWKDGTVERVLHGAR